MDTNFEQMGKEKLILSFNNTSETNTKIQILLVLINRGELDDNKRVEQINET
jgi:hypothetical protein